MVVLVRVDFFDPEGSVVASSVVRLMAIILPDEAVAVRFGVFFERREEIRVEVPADLEPSATFFVAAPEIRFLFGLGMLSTGELETFAVTTLIVLPRFLDLCSNPTL